MSSTTLTVVGALQQSDEKVVVIRRKPHTVDSERLRTKLCRVRFPGYELYGA